MQNKYRSRFLIVLGICWGLVQPPTSRIATAQVGHPNGGVGTNLQVHIHATHRKESPRHQTRPSAAGPAVPVATDRQRFLDLVAINVPVGQQSARSTAMATRSGSIAFPPGEPHFVPLTTPELASYNKRLLHFVEGNGFRITPTPAINVIHGKPQVPPSLSEVNRLLYKRDFAMTVVQYDIIRLTKGTGQFVLPDNHPLLGERVFGSFEHTLSKTGVPFNITGSPPKPDQGWEEVLAVLAAIANLATIVVAIDYIYTKYDSKPPQTPWVPHPQPHESIAVTDPNTGTVTLPVGHSGLDPISVTDPNTHTTITFPGSSGGSARRSRLGSLQ